MLWSIATNRWSLPPHGKNSAKIYGVSNSLGVHLVLLFFVNVIPNILENNLADAHYTLVERLDVSKKECPVYGCNHAVTVGVMYDFQGDQ